MRNRLEKKKAICPRRSRSPRPMTEKRSGRMPPGAKQELRRRLERHEIRWAARAIYFFVLFRSTRAYVRVGFLNHEMNVDGEDCANLCRLEWKGDIDYWGCTFWDPLEGAYIPPRLGGGPAVAAPEACVDASLRSQFCWELPEVSGTEP
jgi:hypothetical protein